MSADYSGEHASALADIRAAGDDVTFTLASPGTQNASDGTYVNPVTITVTGAAIQAKGEKETYARLGLIASEAPTLVFCPDTFGEKPPLMASVAWGGTSWTVRDITPTATAGTAILARVVIAR